MKSRDYLFLLLLPPATAADTQQETLRIHSGLSPSEMFLLSGNPEFSALADPLQAVMACRVVAFAMDLGMPITDAVGEIPKSPIDHRSYFDRIYGLARRYREDARHHPDRQFGAAVDALAFAAWNGMAANRAA